MKEIYLKLYRIISRIRIVDQKIADLYSQQQKNPHAIPIENQIRCPVHLSIGQEAIAAGVCAALNSEDIVLSSHRSHAPYLAKGGDLYSMLAEIYGRATGCCAGRGGSMHLFDAQAGFWGSIPIVGSAIPIATGAAFAFKLQKKTAISTVFLGEGATESGVFHESIQFAALKKLPIVFVCENNGFSVNTPIEERRVEGLKIYNLAKAHGLAIWHNDGNDPAVVYKTAVEAIASARNGTPAFMEFSTYRWKEHCGPNDDYELKCRGKETLDLWMNKCPLKRLKHTLLADLGCTLQSIKDIEEAENKYLNDCLLKVMAAPLANDANNNLFVYSK